MEQAVALEIRGLTKRFFGNLALDNVDFDVRHGEIHALVGENGAGKSTLIKILAGVYSADSGTIRIAGEVVHPDTKLLPIAFVHQDIGLVDELSIGENVALVSGFPKRFGFIHWDRVWKRVHEIYRFMDVEPPDPRQLAQSLNSAERAILGIVRALALKAEVIVLDEPTAALPEPDALHLFAVLKRLRANGTSVIYVTHRLGELFDLADRISVLRDGRVVRTMSVGEATPVGLIEDMLGRPVEATHIGHHSPGDLSPLLVLRNMKVDHWGPIDLDICAGEIVGLVGIRGAGHEAIGRAICGAIPFNEGSMKLGSKNLSRQESIATRMDRGIILAPGDRARDSTFGGMSVTENIFPNLAAVGHRGWSFNSPRSEAGRSRDIIDRFDIRPRSPYALIEWLSGGNQQKAVLARLFSTKATLLILEEPTAGVDIGAKISIHEMLRQAAANGAAILVVSSDFEEVATVCDRAVIMNRGVIGCELRGASLTFDELVARATIGDASWESSEERQ